MTADAPAPIDTNDMIAVHNACKRALGDAPAQIASVSAGDAERARHLADYLVEVLWLLHAHHVGEDELLYPLLTERVPEEQDLFSRMNSQHLAVSAGFEAAERAAAQFGTSGSVLDGQAAARACEALSTTMAEHLSEEEQMVLPIAARYISPPEWGALPAHALQHYSGSRMWLPFGLVLEAMPDEASERLLSNIPPPVSGMWFGGGSDAFANEMRIIRSGMA